MKLHIEVPDINGLEIDVNNDGIHISDEFGYSLLLSAEGLPEVVDALRYVDRSLGRARGVARGKEIGAEIAQRREELKSRQEGGSVHDFS